MVFISDAHSLLFLSVGAVSSLRGVQQCGNDPCDGCASGCRVFSGGVDWRYRGGRHLRDPGGLHVPLHLAHARHRASVRLPLQLHGLPVSGGVSSVRHHGVSDRFIY